MMLDGGTNTKGAARPSAAADQDDRSLQSVMAQRFAELDKDGNGARGEYRDGAGLQ